MPWWLISVHKAGHKEPAAWLSAVMEGRKWEALVKPRIIDQCIQWSVSWAGNKLPGVSNIAVSRVKFHFCDLCRGKHNLLTKQYRIFSQCLARDILWLFTARIPLVSLLFTSLTNETPFGIHEVTSACWKLIQSCAQITRRCKTSITLTFPWISDFHTQMHMHMNTHTPSGMNPSWRLHKKHSPFAQNHSDLLRILFGLHLYYSFYKV